MTELSKRRLKAYRQKILRQFRKDEYVLFTTARFGKARIYTPQQAAQALYIEYLRCYRYDRTNDI